MALIYNPPGVNVSEIVSPSVNTSLSSISTVCLVGPVQGYQLETQQVTIASGTAPFQLIVTTSGEQFLPVGAGQAFVTVTNAVNPVLGSATNQGGYQQGVDFTVSFNVTNTVATITPLGAMTAGGIINFVYQVLSNTYFQATSFSSQSALEQKYGPSYAVGGIQTPTSAAAGAAIENGLVPIVVQPLFRLSNPADPTSTRLQPTSAQIADPTTWQQTLYALRAVQGINFIVPVVGQSFAGISDSQQLSILATVQDHVYYMKTQIGEYIFAVFGEDSTADITEATDATEQSHATTLRQRYGGAVSQNILMLVPSLFTRQNPTNSSATSPLNVGGQYVAAAYAGMIASRSVNSPLTRQVVANLTGIPSYRDLATKNNDAQAGLTVLEVNNNLVQVRHAITLDNTAIENRELNVVRAKFHMISSLTETLNNQVVGQIPADGNATTLVSLVVAGVLDKLKSAGEIVDYGNLQCRLLINSPTTCEVRFSWLPAFPINYINVIFSLDLTGIGGITTTTTVTS